MIDTRYGDVAPETWPEQRLCAEIATDIFFPEPGEREALRAAQAICRSCPALTRCAAWAAPLVAEGLLTDAVVASVRLPAVGGARTEAVEELREVAAAPAIEIRTEAA